MPLADSVHKLAAKCKLCGQPAHFSLRTVASLETELVGGEDVYLPACRACYLAGAGPQPRAGARRSEVIPARPTAR